MIFGVYFLLYFLRNIDDYLYVIYINDLYLYGVRVWKIKVLWNLFLGNWMIIMDDVIIGDF